jgi:hypothetical protein
MQPCALLQRSSLQMPISDLSLGPLYLPPTSKIGDFWKLIQHHNKNKKQAAAARIPPPQKSKISQKFSSCGSKSRSWGSLDMHHLQTRIVSKWWWWWRWSGSSLESRECSSLRDYLPKTRNFMGLLVLFFLDLKQKGNWIDLPLLEGFGF